MGIMKRIATARQLDVYPIESARAMRNYIKNPPQPRSAHLYDANFMNLPLDYTGSTPIDLQNGENYVVVDLNTNAQKVVCVFKLDQIQYVQQIGETMYCELSQYNQISYRWLRIRKFDATKLYRQKAK